MYITDYRDTGAWLEPLGSMRLRPRPDEVARARRWFRLLTQGLRLAPDVLENCVLMLSELVTNTITHGASESPWVVHVEWWRTGTDLRVSVTGPGNGAAVRVRHAREHDESGRGLFLVQTLADSWEVLPCPGGGVEVMFVVKDALPPPTS